MGSGGPLIFVAAILMQVMGAIIPIALVGLAGWFLFSRSSMGRELKRRAETGADRDELVDALSAQVERLQQEMLELQERVDFAERLMADPSRAERLRPGGDS